MQRKRPSICRTGRNIRGKREENGGKGETLGCELGGREAPTPPLTSNRGLVALEIPCLQLHSISGFATGIIPRPGPRQHCGICFGGNISLLPFYLLHVFGGVPGASGGSHGCSSSYRHHCEYQEGVCSHHTLAGAELSEKMRIFTKNN